MPEVNEHLYRNGGWDGRVPKSVSVLENPFPEGSAISRVSVPAPRRGYVVVKTNYIALGSITVLRQRLLSVPAHDQVENVHWT